MTQRATEKDEKDQSVDANQRQVAGPQNELERRVLAVAPQCDLVTLRARLRVDSAFARELSRALDDADTAVNDALMRHEELRGRIMNERIAQGLHETLPINAYFDDPRRGELITSRAGWDPTLQASVRKIVRIYPGENAEFDAARAELEESKKLRRELVDRMLGADGQGGVAGRR